MLKIVVVCLVGFFSVFFHVGNVYADLTQATEDYNFQYKQYKESYNRFSVAKSTYLTYQSLTSQSEAIKKFQEVLNQRNAVLSAYLDMLQEKLYVTPEIEATDIDAYSDIRKDSKDWLDAQQVSINNAVSIADLNNLSQQFASFYPKIEVRIKQVIGRIVLSQAIIINQKNQKIMSDTDNLIKLINQSGENATQLQRDFINIKSKNDLYQAKYIQARQQLFPNDSYISGTIINLSTGQQTLKQGDLYLQDTGRFILEMIKRITG